MTQTITKTWRNELKGKLFMQKLSVACISHNCHYARVFLENWILIALTCNALNVTFSFYGAALKQEWAGKLKNNSTKDRRTSYTRRVIRTNITSSCGKMSDGRCYAGEIMIGRLILLLRDFALTLTGKKFTAILALTKINTCRKSLL